MWKLGRNARRNRRDNSELCAGRALIRNSPVSPVMGVQGVGIIVRLR